MKFSNYFEAHKNDPITNHLLSWPEMVDIARNVKIGKSSAGPIRPESVIHGAPELMRHLHILFNGLIQHSYVPTCFLKGTITPII